MLNQEKHKILIADDTPENIEILASALRKEYKISATTRATDVLKIASGGQPPDLILLDIVMPELDGFQVCTMLKQQEVTRHIPVIFITAKVRVEDETRGLAVGAVDYITKPFSLPIVMARIRTHLELKRSRDILSNIAHLDGLTGIPNRRRFNEFLPREWQRAVRTANPVTIAMLDIDYFKKFNDTYGHAAGDDCLRHVASTLADTAHRSTDFVARYGGEEFIVVLPDTDGDAAQIVCENLRRAVEGLGIEHQLNPNGRVVTLSIGAATMVPHRETESAPLIAEADRHLYRAKEMGRNRISHGNIS